MWKRGWAASHLVITGDLVGGVVVTDQMDVELTRDLGVELGQELLELGGAVPAVDRAVDLAGGHVQGGEQGGDAMAQVIVGPTLRQPGHHRQHRRGAIQGLDLGFFIHAEHQRLLRRVQIESDHIADFVDELRIIADLEGVDQVRFEPERLPDPAHRGLRQSGLFGHRRPRPVGGIRRRALQRGHQHRLDLLIADRAWPTRAGIVTQTVEAILEEALTPFTHRLRPHPHLGSHFLVGFTCRTTQHDPRPLRQRLRGLRPPRPPLQRLTLVVGQHQLRYRPAPTRHSPSLLLFNEFPAQDTSRLVLAAAALAALLINRRLPI